MRQTMDKNNLYQRKIIFISNTANFQKFNLPFMHWCSNQGWQVDYACPNDEPVKDCDNYFDVEISRSPFSLKNLKAIITLKNILKNGNYNILHCHTPMGAVVARLAGKSFRKNGLKIIYTAHGFHFYKGAPILNWIMFYPVEKWLSKYTDVLVCINEEDYELAMRKKFKAKKIVKIDGVGVNLEKYNLLSL